MAGLISSLHNSSAALRVHSKGLEVTGKNLANVNNRGYSKERVEIGDRGQINTGVATESMGVEAMGLRQNRDALLDKSVMRELTTTADLEAAKKVLTSAETALGQFLDRTKDSTSIQNAMGASGGAIGDALTDFFNAWESVSVKPQDVGEKQLLIEKAKILAEKLNQTDKRLSQVQTDVDAQLKTDVVTVNQLLDEIAKTNDYIAKAELLKPYSAVDLRDQRQAKLEELSKYLDVQFENITDGLGQIKVTSGNVTLVDGNEVAGQLAYQDDSTVAGFRTFILGGNPFVPANGKLAAQLESSTGTVQNARNEIATLKTNLKNEVNSAYTPAAFFAVDSTTGSISVSATSISAGANGSNQIALNLAELGTKTFTALGSSTFNSYFNKTVTTVAQQLNSTNTRLEDQKLSEEMAVNSRDQYSGVSQDEEITDMMKFQRSFQASARHINVIDTLLEQVVNRLGVG
ncbi:MAG: flagellar hook-associated protein FlgK [Verrucomicrobia bacterium]|nr:flagellar hook-associated protein FlgK [Verrucomicrobiota bacterium]